MTKRKWFREFCDKPTTQCMQYFVMNDRPPAEKCLWVLVFFCMTSASVSALISFINVWMYSPTVIYVENTESDIRDIPFPSMKICSTNQIRKLVWERHENTNTSYWKRLQHYRSLVCNSHMYATKSNQDIREYVEHNELMDFMNDCAIDCSEIFQSDVQWQNTIITDFCKVIQPIATPLGICYTINMLPSSQIFNENYHQRYLNFFSKKNTYIDTGQSNWNLDDGYSYYSEDKILTDVTPARTSGVSRYHRLKFRLHFPEDEFLRCPNLAYSDGLFIVGVSNPVDYYTFISRATVVRDTNMKIQISPLVRKISSDLKWRSLEIRQCYLQDERKLAIFKQYTEYNCRYECTLNMTISMCGCLNLESSPLAKDDMKICALAKKDCVNKSSKAAQMPETQIKCNCLPTCSVIEYDIFSSSNYENWDYLKTANIVKNNSRGATVEIVFKNSYFTAYKSGSIVNLHSLIGNVGGILGLFLGLNMINIFEILYVVIGFVSYCKVINTF